MRYFRFLGVPELNRTDGRTAMRIGEGAGYQGAWLQPAVDLATSGDLDYLTLECLAERTVSLGNLDRRSDPERGYDPNLRRRLQALLRPCLEAGTKLVTSMGAANPAAAGELAAAVARETGLKGLRIAVVTGDDVLSDVKDGDYELMDGAGELGSIMDRIVSANAYLGAQPLVDALEAGADLVLTGRVADPSLHLACMRHKFGWGESEGQILGAGTAVAHLLECGPQVTGGYFADPGFKEVPALENIGSPIAEVFPDGSAIITKLTGTGGIVTTATCIEQLLYEVHDPGNYVTPDVVADFTGMEMEQLGPDRVRVWGATGRPATSTLKVSVGYLDGYVGEGQISYAGAGCVSRARLAGEIIRRRLEAAELPIDGLKTELIGVDAMLGRQRSAGRPEPAEVRLRVAGRSTDRDAAEAIGREVEGLWIAGPYGGTGATRDVREVLSIASILMPRGLVRPEVTILEP